MTSLKSFKPTIIATVYYNEPVTVLLKILKLSTISITQLLLTDDAIGLN